MPRITAPKSTTRTIRRLAGEVADYMAITHAFAELADDAARDLMGAIPPATDRAAADRLAFTLAALHSAALTGRRLARRLCAALAKGNA